MWCNAKVSVGINEFVRRQVPNSRFAHFNGTFEQVAALAEQHFSQAVPGYRDGVCLVPVPAEGFCTSTVTVTDLLPLRATFQARQAGEDASIIVTVTGDKAPAQAVDLVLYRHDVLAENNEQSGEECEWELISINARICQQAEPMHPVTMARNFLTLKGGTKGEYTAEQFAEAIIFWSKHVLATPLS